MLLQLVLIRATKGTNGWWAHTLICKHLAKRILLESLIILINKMKFVNNNKGVIIVIEFGLLSF